MKIQCDCGAKYAFDVTPEMVKQPVQFVCQLCEVDSSTRVNAMIQAEFAAAPAPVSAPPPPAPAPRGPARVSIARSTKTHGVPVAEPTAPAESPGAVPCRKHPGQVAVEQCRVCQKPICPK